MTRTEIASRLAKLSKEMQTLGAQMDYFGGFDAEMAKHGRELFAAGVTCKDWADKLKAESKE